MKPTEPRVLTINGGSSSIKFALFDVGGVIQQIFGGTLERIGTPQASLSVKSTKPDDNFSRPVAAADVAAAVNVLMNWIEEQGGREVLAGVGHRVVHGGPTYSEPQ